MALELAGGPSRATACSPCGRRPTRGSRCSTPRSPPACWAIPLGGLRPGRGDAHAGLSGDRGRRPRAGRSRAELPPLSPPVTILGRLSKAGERDEFTITAPPGSKHKVRVEAWGLGSALDGQRVFGKDGRSLGESGDAGATGRRTGGGGGRAQGPVSTDPKFDLTMPEGQDQVRLVVKDLVDRGGVGFTYRVVVKPVETAFQLALNDEQVAIPRGGLALVPVTVTRAGYNGPIALDVLGIPSGGGVTVQAGTVPPARRAAWSASRPTARAHSTRLKWEWWARDLTARPSRRPGRSSSHSRRSRRPASASRGRSRAAGGRSSASPRR